MPRYIRSCPSDIEDTTTGRHPFDPLPTTTMEPVDFCKNSTAIAPYCRIGNCDLSDCVASKQCAMRSGDCTCE